MALVQFAVLLRDIYLIALALWKVWEFPATVRATATGEDAETLLAL